MAQLCSQFLCLESLVTTLTDLFPRHLRRPWAREILVLAIAVVFFLLGLPLLTKVSRSKSIISTGIKNNSMKTMNNKTLKSDNYVSNYENMGMSCTAAWALSHRKLLYREGCPHSMIAKHSLIFYVTDNLFNSEPRTSSCCTFFLLMFQGGRNLFNLIDIYGVSVISLLFIACFETITIGWVYGK